MIKLKVPHGKEGGYWLEKSSGNNYYIELKIRAFWQTCKLK
jgi:hypothetical protein